MRHYCFLLILSFCLLALPALPGLPNPVVGPALGAAPQATAPKKDKADKAAKAEDAGKDKAADAAPDQKADDAKAEEKPLLPEHDPWEMVWAGQQDRLNQIKQIASKLSDGFADEAGPSHGKGPALRRRARRRLVLTNTFKNWPNPMEAVSRRITGHGQPGKPGAGAHPAGPLRGPGPAGAGQLPGRQPCPRICTTGD